MNKDEKLKNFYEKAFFLIAIFGLALSFIMVGKFHTNPFRIPTFCNIPICYIYGNAYIAILLSALMKRSFLSSIISIIGFVLGLSVSGYFIFIYLRFGNHANIFTVELFGIKTVYYDCISFCSLLFLALLKKP